MKLTCFLDQGWEPVIQPGNAARDWIDELPEAYGYRCLPLTIANTHGWEILSLVSFEACWMGGSGKDSLIIHSCDGHENPMAPVSLFGAGVMTFHIAGLFRTPPNWNLWVSGPPNMFKDGIQPLSGIIETDWSPYSFTMNWKFTRPRQWIKFRAGDPIAFIFPIPHAAIEQFEPEFKRFEDDPQLKEDYYKWRSDRDQFIKEQGQRKTPSAGWQKFYYRGCDMRGRTVPNHRSKLKVRPFANPPAEAPNIDPEVIDAPELAKAIVLTADALKAKLPDDSLVAHLIKIGFTAEIAHHVIALAREKSDSD